MNRTPDSIDRPGDSVTEALYIPDRTLPSWVYAVALIVAVDLAADMVTFGVLLLVVAGVLP